MKIPILLSLTFAFSLPVLAEDPKSGTNEVKKVEICTEKATAEVKEESCKVDQTVKHEKTDAEKAACETENKVKCDADKAWQSTKEAGQGVGDVAKGAAEVALQGTAKVADKVTEGLSKAAETLKHTAKKLEGEDKSE